MPRTKRDIQRDAGRAKAVARAISYIDERFHKRLSLEEIAVAACASRFHFTRIFRIETGMSPMQYLRKKRVEEAKRLLGTGRLTIMRVAEDLGYFDQSHLCREFRSLTGTTPKQYMLRTARVHFTSRLPAMPALSNKIDSTAP